MTKWVICKNFHCYSSPAPSTVILHLGFPKITWEPWSVAPLALLVGALSPTPEVGGFDFWPGYIPGFQVRSLVRVCTGGNCGCFFSHMDAPLPLLLPTSLPSSLPLSKYILGWGLGKEWKKKEETQIWETFECCWNFKPQPKPISGRSIQAIVTGSQDWEFLVPS